MRPFSQLWLAVNGMLTGPTLAVFTLGVLVPVANYLGAIIGFFAGTGLRATLI